MKNVEDVVLEILSVNVEDRVNLIKKMSWPELTETAGAISDRYSNNENPEIKDLAKKIKSLLVKNNSKLEQAIKSQVIALINTLSKKNQLEQMEKEAIQSKMIKEENLETVIEKQILAVKVDSGTINASIEETLKDVISGTLLSLISEHGIGAALLCIKYTNEGKVKEIEDYLDTLIPKGKSDIRRSLKRVICIVSNTITSNEQELFRQLARGSKISENQLEQATTEMFRHIIKGIYITLNAQPNAEKLLLREQNELSTKPKDDSWRKDVDLPQEINNLEHNLSAGIINIPRLQIELNKEVPDPVHVILLEVGQKMLAILKADREVIMVNSLAIELRNQKLNELMTHLKELFKYLEQKEHNTPGMVASINLLLSYYKSMLMSINFNAEVVKYKLNDQKLESLSHNKIELLASEEAMLVYQIGNITIQDLKDLDIEKIEVLISWKAREAYETGQVTAQDLKDLDIEKIRMLISLEAREAYETRQVTAQDLKGLDIAKFRVLVSKEALTAYKTGQVSAQDLKDLDIAKFRVLVSKEALTAYKTGQVTVHDLKDLDVKKIEVLVSEEALTTYKTGQVSAQDLKDLDVKKIEVLVSKEALTAYKTGQVSAQDLKDLDIKKIKVLTSWEARDAYRTGQVSAQDLKDLDIKKIEMLISWEARTAYQSGYVTIKDLLAADAIGRNILKAYAKYACNEFALDYIDKLSNSKVELLISSEALQAYNTGKVSVQSLQDLSEKEIKVLISWRAIEAYRTGQVSASDLKGLRIEEVDLLIAADAREAYKTGRVSVNDLKGLSEEKLDLLLSSKTLEEYKQFEKLTVKDVLLIHQTSDQIGKNLFQEGVSASRIEDTNRILTSLLEAVNDVKAKNPNLQINNLDVGELKWNTVGKAKGEGLSEFFYKMCSYTALGHVTGGICFPEQNMTKDFKKQLQNYIEHSAPSASRNNVDSQRTL